MRWLRKLLDIWVLRPRKYTMTITDGEGNSRTTVHMGETERIGRIPLARPWAIEPPPAPQRPLQAEVWFQDGGGI